jgi:hypothetical protein
MFAIPDLSYSNNQTGPCEITGAVPGILDGAFDACGGVQTVTWEFTDDCDRTITHTQNITIDPAPPAQFINPPGAITLTCDEVVNFSIDSLSYSNGESGACEISGSVPGTLSGTFDECGGTQMITWEFTDDCGRPITHTQNITIDPAPQAQFIDPPGSITFDCDEVVNFSIDSLSFSNGDSGACEISGSVPGTLSGTFDECGGTQTITWEFTDDCGRTIMHTQNITINPAPQAQFINPPALITVTCDEADNFSIDSLSYSNGESGACQISGSVPGTLSGTFDECGGTQTITWEFTDDCGRSITHTQNITIDPAPQAQFINPPGSINLTCDEAITFTIDDLNYSNNLSASCEISGSVPGTLTGTFDACGGTQTITWEFTDDCGRTITHTQNITIDPAPQSQFSNPPGPVSLTCDEAVNFVVEDLDYSNNASGACEISGIVPGMLSGNVDCGGTRVAVWEFTDDCGRTITHTQNITVDAPPQAQFINPPGAIALTCGQADVFMADSLSYSNSASGICEIDGAVPGMLSGTFDECGGSQTITSVFTEDCV